MQSLARLLPLVAAAHALVPAPRPALQADEPVLEPRFLGTSALITVQNQWTKPCKCGGSDGKYMAVPPPKSFSIPASSVSTAYPVEAEGMIPLQSSFNFCCTPENERQSCASINIGVAPWKTGFTYAPNNPSSQMGIMQAPAKILEAGRDFDYEIITGQGAFTSFANSLIKSKVDGFISGLSQKPIEIQASADIKLTIKTVKEYSVVATYVSLDNMPTGGSKIDGIVALSGTISGTLDLKGVKQDFKIKAGGASIMISAEGNLFAAAKSAALNIEIKRALLSLDTIDLEGDFLVDVVGALYPVLAPVLKLPYKLCSIVNTSENAKIIALLNKAIKSLA
ncbi:hypothetical protein Dda_8262 [Drechslerella dactyloides]|uniref:Uncharacterized protein n=1 Tax=Drechslerella dactyloides TaxID=74499 RepID=A0AAD6IRN4_DREDA|nr:hypothetical protein Dda_8262 [Drechslerella dactyloides]